MGVLRLALCGLGVLAVLTVGARDDPPAADSGQITNLDELLEAVRGAQSDEQRLNEQREREFLRERENQRALLEQARRNFQMLQEENNPLLAITEANAREIERLQKQLKTQSRDLGDVYSVFNEFSRDFAAALNDSMITSQHPARTGRLAALVGDEKLATIDDMEDLWLLLQEEMTEAARVTSFESPVISVEGRTAKREVMRVGTFTAFGEAEFLRYVPETGELLALNRQPPARMVRQASAFSTSRNELLSMVVDPSRGSLLGALHYTPTLRERIEQGGPIGLIIIGLGALGLLLTIWRTAYLGAVYLRIRIQLRNVGEPRNNNPLGRVIRSAGELSSLEGDEDATSLQYQLDQAILAELPRLEHGQSLIKLLAAIAPLLGLLGTVTGMILTFQAISLFGSGDPRLMAGGISQALVTTVLGLIVAVPLLFGHNLVSSLSRAMIQHLDEQSAGIMARLMERRDKETYGS